MWGKSKKNSKGASKSPKATNPEVVVSHIAPRGVSRVISKLRSKKVMYGAGALVLVAVTVGGFAFWQNQRDKPYREKEDPPYVMTDEEYAKIQAAGLRKAKPAQDAAVEDKKAYYDELTTNELMAGNPKGAVDAYGDAVTALQETNLGLNTYVAAAQSYAKLGDKGKAESVLAVAEQVVKRAAYTDETKRQDLLDTIAYVREEIKK